MAPQATRAYLVDSGDYYCCPLSKVQLSADELRELLSPVWRGELKPTEIEWESAEGKREVVALGFEKKRRKPDEGVEDRDRYDMGRASAHCALTQTGKSARCRLSANV